MKPFSSMQIVWMKKSSMFIDNYLKKKKLLSVYAVTDNLQKLKLGCRLQCYCIISWHCYLNIKVEKYSVEIFIHWPKIKLPHFEGGQCWLSLGHRMRMQRSCRYSCRIFKVFDEKYCIAEYNSTLIQVNWFHLVYLFNGTSTPR